VVTAYFVFLGDFLPPLGEVLTEYPISRGACILICLILAIPLAIPEKLSALQYLTPISTLSLLMTSAVAGFRASQMVSSIEPRSAALEVRTPDHYYIKGFAIVTSAFICHSNVISVAEELVNPTLGRVNKVAFRAALVQVILYLAIAVCGYISFGNAVEQNFINNYPNNDALITLCRCFLSLTIFLGLSFNTNPTAKAVVNIYKRVKEVAHVSWLPEFTDSLRVSSGFITLLSGATVSLIVPGIADVMSFVGGTLGALIMLVFPPLIYLNVFRDEMNDRLNQISVLLLLASAAVCFAYAL
jgi:amino acid permease